MLPLFRKALGGSKEVLQLMLYQSIMEHWLPTPMPNGEGTVRFPQLRWQSGLVVLGAGSMFSGAVYDEFEVVAAIKMARARRIEHGRADEIVGKGSMFLLVVVYNQLH
ncbi:hypothetical protein Ancab_000309 [Ancistrocladus abbreviatus]